MHAAWLDSVATRALVAVSGLSLLAVSPVPTLAQGRGPVEAAIPLPEPANVPPPTIKDLDPAPARGEPPAGHSASAEGTEAGQPATTGSVSQPPAPAAEASAPAERPSPTEQAQIEAAPDAPLRAKLAELVAAGKLDRTLDRKRDRAAVEDFYKGRGYAPLWISEGAPNERMKAMAALLKAADADGLDPSDYALPEIKDNTPEALAAAELKATTTALNYARHAQTGRVAPSRISANIEYAITPPEAAEILKKLADAPSAADALASYHPTHAGYKALREKLAELRGRGEGASATVPGGPTLRQGMSDPRVPLLRQRLNLVSLAGDTTYDAELVDAVKAFQRSKGIGGKGALTPATVEAMNGRGHSREIDTIVSNMERWRWLPRDLGRTYVMVNIPDFTLKMVRDGSVAFRTKVVVGKPETPTPVFSDEIENIVVNPTWHVPQSIIYNEYLPALQQDRGALARMGLRLSRARDGSISVTQPPGERNALGQMKFNFPNRFNVYLHDTPTKHLFAVERRAYSHGCMRVQNPTQFGEALLAAAGNAGEHFSADRLKGMFNTGERWLKLKPFVQVHLTYMNAFVDEAGKLVIREDLYGLDGRVRAALRGDTVVAERSAPKPNRRAVADAGRPERVASAMRTRRPVRQQVVYEQPRPQPGLFFFPFFR